MQGQRVSGILVKRNFNYHIMTPTDLPSQSNHTYPCMEGLESVCVSVCERVGGWWVCVFCVCVYVCVRVCVCVCSSNAVCVVCPDYTDLSVGTVTQVQAVPYTGPISLLVSQLRSLTGQFTIMHQFYESACPCSWGEFLITYVCVCSGDVEQVEAASKITIRILKSITLVHEGGMVLLEVGWKCCDKR